MPKSENVQLVESLYAAFAQGNIPAVLEEFAPDIEWQQAENTPYTTAGPVRGRQAVLDSIFSRLAEDWDGFTVTPREYMDAGGTVIALGRYSGTHRRTGRQIYAQFAHLWDMRGGKVARYRQYTDTLQIAEAFGTVTRAAAASAPAH